MIVINVFSLFNEVNYNVSIKDLSNKCLIIIISIKHFYNSFYALKKKKFLLWQRRPRLLNDAHLNVNGFIPILVTP